jgi:hypothetical protein
VINLSQNFNQYDIGIDADGKLAVSRGRDAYANSISATLRTLQGELQLDVEAGIPYIETIFESYNNIELWKHRVREAVESFDFVVSIDSFTAKWDTATNTLSYTLVITTTQGEVEVSNEQ